MIDRKKILETMAGFLKKPIDSLKDDALLTDLVTQSFMLVEMVIELQEEFRVRFGQEELKQVRTVADLLDLMESVGTK